MDVLQQHAAMIGGATPTSCPLCHKILIGTDALIEHMKYNHKDPNPPPSPLASKLSFSKFCFKKRTRGYSQELNGVKSWVRWGTP